MHSVKLICDRETGRPRGFGFIEMEPECADAARSALDGSDFCGRALCVDDAEVHENRRARKSW